MPRAGRKAVTPIVGSSSAEIAIHEISNAFLIWMFIATISIRKSKKLRCQGEMVGAL
jgi:hypothetical protein